MSSEFKKLISRELGRSNYNRYASFIRSGLQDKRMDLKEIFRDIYSQLEYDDAKEIVTRHNRLNDSLLDAFRINRTYLFSFLFYTAAVIFLIAADLKFAPALAAFVAITLVFLKRTCEYLENKYCYVDAQIVLIYKAVLERLIVNKGLKRGAGGN